MSKCMYNTHAGCVCPLEPCAYVILLTDIYSCAHTRARSALEFGSYTLRHT